MTDPKDKENEAELEHDDPLDGVDETVVTDSPEGDDEATAKVDEELEAAENDTEREEIRARRKNERKSRSQRNRERVETLERNLQALTAQNQTLQQQMSTIQSTSAGSQLAQVDAAINQANQAAEHFKNVIAQAASRNDGKTLAEATEYMIASRTRAKELSDFKVNATRALNAPKPLNPSLVSKSQAFMSKNTWYGGPTSADPDSKVLTALDNSLTAEGWDPTDDSYWVELNKRAEKYLPHRLNKAPPSRSGNPVSGSNRSSGSSDQGGVFQLSPERVAAIKSAGMWDDPVTRTKMIKSYRNFDKQNAKG
jgi:hypothetical protein